ncbi:hypothetical protein BDZ97DRAFT_1915620 [Flammula alnicola]|nr:hypothetical protein BDZ97DRAFT_1915620 [Flammula alnicola]
MKHAQLEGPSDPSKPTAKRKARQMSDQEDGMSVSSDGESEYSSKNKRAGKARAAKKARKSGLASCQDQQTPVKKPTRQRNTLSLLPTMPLDILFEILGFLPPEDLFNLTKTNKLFRETLLSSQATTVWKAARERMEHRNVRATSTSHAGRRYSSGIFVSMQETEVGCKEKFKTRFPDIDKSILELVPSTNVVDGTALPAAAANANISGRRPDAKKNMENFKAEQCQLVENIRHERRKDQIYERFLQLGYLNADLEDLENDPECKKTTEITDRIWQRIRPALEKKSTTERKRLAEERESVLISRRQIVDGLYTTYKSTLQPSQWRYLPRTLNVCQFECFAQLIEAGSDVTITAAHFMECMQMLPECSRGIRRNANELRGMMAGATITSFTRNDSSETHATGESSTQSSTSAWKGLDCLDLATAVFDCQKYCRSTGWGTGRAWSSAGTQSPRITKFKFDATAASIAQSVVLCAGLNVETALASDMDAMDLRFTCTQCETFRASVDFIELGIPGVQLCVLPYFALVHFPRSGTDTSSIQVLHGKTSHRHATSPLGWEILSSSDTEIIKEKQQQTSSRQYRLWTCSHCSAYLTKHDQRPTVIQHIVKEHGISVPKEPDDLFLFERVQWLGYPVVTYLVPKPSDDA